MSIVFSRFCFGGASSGQLSGKEITLIIQAAPGGVSDAVGRAMAAAAKKSWESQSFLPISLVQPEQLLWGNSKKAHQMVTR